MKLVLNATICVLLSSCASSLTSPAGQKLAKGEIQPVLTAPAVRIGAKANLLHQGKRLKFDVWIEADSTRGRLDALGPFGTPLATVIWEDSAWKAWLPGQSTLLRGYGNAVNLPVLGLKDLRPSALVAPLLGSIFPRSGMVRFADANNNQALVVPLAQPPSWSLLIDKSTGLPIRRQRLEGNREVEGLTFHQWRKKDGILFPGTLDRTTPDGQLLQLVTEEWSILPSLPTEHLQLKIQAPVDTITMARNDRGQTIYRIRAAVEGGDSTTVVLSGSQAMNDAPMDDPTTMSSDDTLGTEEDADETDSTGLDVDSASSRSESETDAPASEGQKQKSKSNSPAKAIIPDKHGRKR